MNKAQGDLIYSLDGIQRLGEFQTLYQIPPTWKHVIDWLLIDWLTFQSTEPSLTDCQSHMYRCEAINDWLGLVWVSCWPVGLQQKDSLFFLNLEHKTFLFSPSSAHRLLFPLKKQGYPVSPARKCIKICLLVEEITKGDSLEIQGSIHRGGIHWCPWKLCVIGINIHGCWGFH